MNGETTSPLTREPKRRLTFVARVLQCYQSVQGVAKGRGIMHWADGRSIRRDQ